MKLIRAFSITLLATSLAIASTGQDGTPIRRSVAEGATEKYEIAVSLQGTTSSALFGDKDLKMSALSKYVLKFGKLDAATGLTQVDASQTIEDIKADGFAGGLTGQKPGPMTAKGTIDSRNRLQLKSDSSGGLASLLMGSAASAAPSTMFVELPEKAVKIGDTWDVTIPKSPMTAPTDQKLTATLVGEKQIEGKAVWVISLTGTFATDIDTANLPKPANPSPDETLSGIHLLIKGTTEVKAEGFVDKATGQTLKLSSEGKVTTRAEAPDLGLKLSSDSKVLTVVTAKGS